MESLILVLMRVVNVLEELQIPFAIGGSLASSRYGEIRTTQDIDLVADMHLSHVEPFVDALQDQFYVDAEMIRDAILTRGAFNIIHFETADKIDIFIPKLDQWHKNQMKRKQNESVEQTGQVHLLPFISPEDVILHKLLWFRMGGEVSERQWRDVQGVLKVQAQALELEYLNEWAEVLKVSDLLARAIKEAWT